MSRYDLSQVIVFLNHQLRTRLKDYDLPDARPPESWTATEENGKEVLTTWTWFLVETEDPSVFYLRYKYGPDSDVTLKCRRKDRSTFEFISVSTDERVVVLPFAS